MVAVKGADTAEDQAMVLGALALLLEPEIEVIGQARDGAEALRTIQFLTRRCPDRYRNAANHQARTGIRKSRGTAACPHDHLYDVWTSRVLEAGRDAGSFQLPGEGCAGYGAAGRRAMRSCGRQGHRPEFTAEAWTKAAP